MKNDWLKTNPFVFRFVKMKLDVLQIGFNDFNLIKMNKEMKNVSKFFSDCNWTETHFDKRHPKLLEQTAAFTVDTSS